LLPRVSLKEEVTQTKSVTEGRGHSDVPVKDDSGHSDVSVKDDSGHWRKRLLRRANLVSAKKEVSAGRGNLDLSCVCQEKGH
jgi:hypothetical protein